MSHHCSFCIRHGLLIHLGGTRFRLYFSRIIFDRIVTLSRLRSPLFGLAVSQPQSSDYGVNQGWLTGFRAIQPQPDGFGASQPQPSDYEVRQSQPSDYEVSQPQPSIYDVSQPQPSGLRDSQLQRSDYEVSQSQPSINKVSQPQPSN